jgi:threonine dehydratase
MPHDEIMESMTGDRFAKEDATFVHPFGDPAIIAGQGTIGIEILDDLPDVATVLVPVGGGGLAAGIATAVKAHKHDVKVFGVQAANAAPLVEAYKTGREARVATPKTIADGIAASIAFDYMAPLLRARLDGVLTVGEDDLRAAVRHLALESHVVAEAAGAASFAAARAHPDTLKAPVACIISGGNIDPTLLARLLGPPS